MKSLKLPGVTLGDIYKGALPFIALQIIGLVFVVFFPGIVTYLTNLAFVR